jgi:hypothetical protein
MAQAVSCRLPTTKAWVWARVRSCEICGGQSGTGAGFLRLLQFPLLSIPPNAPHWSSSIIIRSWHNSVVVASVIVDSIPVHSKGKKKSLTYSECGHLLIFFNFGGCILLRPLLWLVFGCAVNRNNFLFPYSPFHTTICFGLYRPSSGGIYTVVFRSCYA